MSYFSRFQPGGGLPIPDRSASPFTINQRHAVLDSALEIPDPESRGLATLSLGTGCFWGAEKMFWQLPGVVTTAVGFQGGTTRFPTYEESCTGRTGHAEVVRVIYDPDTISLASILKVFWENHDPTQVNRQGNDVGSEYRSAVFAPESDLEQVRESLRRYDEVLRADGYDPISTDVGDQNQFPFYFAEPYHQQYLDRNPNGYNCHSSTGVKYPE